MLVNAVERTQTAAIVKNRDGASAAEALTEAVDRAVEDAQLAEARRLPGVLSLEAL